MTTACSHRLGRTAFLLGITCLLAAGPAPAGPPGPPGSDAAMMRTLNEIEPDTVITQLPYLIVESGSYTIVRDLQGTADLDGISIATQNVTLDLNGFSLKGVQGTSGSAINVSGTSQNITVCNGTVKGWGDHGVSASGANGSVFERVRAYANGKTGLDLGGDSLVQDCVARGNNQDGIRVGDSSTVRGCSAQYNTGTGIYAGYGSRIVECTANHNTSNGIMAMTYATVERCTVLKNTLHGIYVGTRCRIVGNSCGENDQDHTNEGAGIYVTGNSSRIEDNNLVENTYGIAISDYLVQDNLIVRNSASQNVTNFLWSSGGNHYGQILTSNTMGDSFTNSNPWVNFSL